jgi:hypothetical protein
MRIRGVACLVPRTFDIGAPGVFQDLAATLGVEIRFKRPGVPLMHLNSYRIDAPADERRELEERIPARHLLRRINPIATRVLGDLRRKLQPFYSEIRRPSIDPETEDHHRPDMDLCPRLRNHLR